VINTIQYNTVQYSTVQYSTVQYSTIQHNTIQHNTREWALDVYAGYKIMSTEYYVVKVYKLKR